MDSQTIFAQLRDTLAELYAREEDSYIIVADAGLSGIRIAFSSRAQTNWHNILIEAINTNALDNLLKIAKQNYSSNSALQNALNQYRLFLESGGIIIPPDPISDNSITFKFVNTEGAAYIAGNVIVEGDFASRDLIKIEEEKAYNVHGLINPYLGFSPFTYKDQEIFAGREQLAKEAVRLLADDSAPRHIHFVTGVSGSGKSSFVQAALLPKLELHYKEEYNKVVEFAVFRPSKRPMDNLCKALTRLHPALSPDDLTASISTGQVSILIIDQFEELFTQSELVQRNRLYEFLINLPPFPEVGIHVISTLRIDYLKPLYLLQPLWEIAKSSTEVREMRDDELSDAIQRPLQIKYPDKRFSADLLARLKKDAAGDPTLLPLLQVTLVDLWGKGSLTLGNYHDLSDAIRKRADTVLKYADHENYYPSVERSAVEQAEILNIFLDLVNVTPDDTERRDVRERRTLDELTAISLSRSALIEELIKARLLAVSTESDNKENEVVEKVDIIHESLIDNWDRLKDAIDEQRENLKRRTRFKLWLNLWKQNKFDDKHLLLTEIQLAEAQILYEKNDIEFRSDEDARRFYQKSQAHQSNLREAEAKEKAENRARQRWLQRLGIALAVAMVAAGIAVTQWQRAQILTVRETEARQTSDANAEGAKQAEATAVSDAQAKAIAEAQAKQQAEVAQIAQVTAVAANAEAERLNRQIRADQLSANGLRISNDSPQLALLLTIEGINSQLRKDEPVVISAQENLRRLFYEFGGMPLVGHEAPITAMAFSIDGQSLASASEDHTVRVWNIVNPQQDVAVLRSMNEETIKVLSFSPDGNSLIAETSNSFLIWNINKPMAYPYTRTNLSWFKFSPDHQSVVFQDENNILWLLRLIDQHEQILTSEFVINHFAFSPDSKWLVVHTNTESSLLWDLTQPAIPPVKLQNSKAGIQDFAFSPNSRWLVGRTHSNLLLWSIPTSVVEPISLGVRTNQIGDYLFSDDGRELMAYGSSNSGVNAVFLWNMDQLNEAPKIFAQSEPVNKIKLSPDGIWFAILTDAQTLRLLRTDQFEAPLFNEWPNVDGVSLEFSKDSRVLWAWGREKLDFFSLISDGKTPGHASVQHNQNTLILSPSEGRFLGYKDDQRFLWLSRSYASIGSGDIDSSVLRGHDSPINLAIFSMDGELIASADGKNTIRIWKTNRPYIDPIIFDSGKYEISPDMQWLVYTDDSNIILASTDVRNTKSIRLNAGKQIQSFLFSPSGKWIVAFLEGDIIKLWEIANFQQSNLEFNSFGIESHRIEFNTDETLMVAACNDSLCLWSLEKQNNDPIVLEQVPNTTYIFSPNGQWLASASSMKPVHLWNITKLNEPAIILSNNQGSDTWSGLEFSSDSQWLGRENSPGSPLIWNVNQQIPLTLDLADTGGFSFSPDAKWLSVAGEWNEQTRTSPGYLWNLSNTKDSPIMLQHAGVVTFIQKHHWGVHTIHDTIKIWDLDDLASDAKTLNMVGGITSFEISPSESLMAAASNDEGALQLWDTDRLDDGPTTLRGYLGSSIQFTADEQWLISNDLHMWRLNPLSIDSLILPTSDNSFPYFPADPTAIDRLNIDKNSKWLAQNVGGFQAFKYLSRIQTRDLIDAICYTIGRNQTLVEWQQNFGDTDYNKTCPSEPLPLTTIQPLLDSGRELARGGLINEAIAKFDEALEIEPQLAIKPDMEARWIVGLRLMDEGQAIAYSGDFDGAVKKFSNAMAFMPELELSPEHEAKRLTIYGLVHQAQQLGDDNEFEQAAEKIATALELESRADLEKLRAKWLVGYGRQTAQKGDTRQGISIFKEAMALDSSIEFAPEYEASIEYIRGLVNAGDYAKAIPILEAAKAMGFVTDINQVLTADDWSELCWDGSWDNHVALVWPACERAIALTQHNCYAYSSHGVANAIENRVEKAITDFDSFLVCARNENYESSKTRRDEIWLAALKENVNLIQAKLLARNGQYAESLAIVNAAENISSFFEITETLTANEWSQICWGGSWDGKAATVLAACERAVDVAPDTCYVHDVRGFAYALVDKQTDAITELSTFIDCAKTSTGYSDLTINRREGWREGLIHNVNLIEATVLAQSGLITTSLSIFKAAEALDISPNALATDWNILCWNGSLNGYAADVLDICENAVNARPEAGGIRDSRGLARALTGDIQGAIEDFEFFVQWSENPEVSASNVEWRKAWIIDLKDGKNPFDEAILAKLRDE